MSSSAASSAPAAGSVPVVHPIGRHRSPLVMVEAASGAVEAVVDAAAALAPFGPPPGGYYPGLRRVIRPGDGAAWAYVDATLRACLPIVRRTFGADGFELIEASFSMVTTPPAALLPAQRAPHFDSVDPDHIAILHYLGGTAGSGTAFYRQRSTGIERVEAANVARFVVTAQAESAGLSGYTGASNAAFEQIAAVAAEPDRLILYQGALLHSGIIPLDASLSPDPRNGRLTANFFVRAYRRAAPA